MKRTLSLAVGLACAWFGYNAVSADETKTNSAPMRIGVYDSRAVAYAWFWSEPYQMKLREQIAAASAARQAGDTAKFKELNDAIRARQDQNHRQVFSTAPVDDALTVIKGRIPEIEKQSGVTALVSKWDETTLKQYENAKQVDVTDRLVREFLNPTEEQQKTIESLKKAKPLSLKKCDELLRKREL